MKKTASRPITEVMIHEITTSTDAMVLDAGVRDERVMPTEKSAPKDSLQSRIRA